MKLPITWNPKNPTSHNTMSTDAIVVSIEPNKLCHYPLSIPLSS
jgi:hypothetical protein